jgi:hypothetical protein
MKFLVIKVQPLDNYQLRLTFKSVEVKLFDIKPFLEVGIFKTLKDEAIFKTATLNFDTVEWANSVDIDPEFLYQESVVEVKEMAAF